jgi:CO/xanthine dehydrogenase Mo-binding subunit
VWIVSAIGVAGPRRDSEAKVLGRTRYAGDLAVPGLLHARLVLAHEAHAMIAAIDTTAALQSPGVIAVLTAADLPVAGPGRGRSLAPLAREEVVYAGQPVAVVVADSEAHAADGLEGVIVELEPVEVVLDLEAATRVGAAAARVRTSLDDEGSDIADAHAAVATQDAGGDEERSANVLGSARLATGDVAAALRDSHVVVSGRFRTPWVHQGYMETQSVTAWVEPTGELVVHASTQGTFAARSAIAQLLGLALDRIRVQAAPMGGGFGGKLVLLEPLVAAVAWALKAPVRLALTRSEDMAASNPVGAELIDLELGAGADGRLRGLRSRILFDRGSTDEFGIESIAALLASGPYRWEAHEAECYGVATNRVTFGAYRAPSSVPAAFAVESLIDELAQRLDIDPIELRLRNVAQQGDLNAAGTPFPVFGARECLTRLQEHPLWRGRHALGKHEGVGVAIGWWPGGYEPAAAACRMDSDGRLTIITGAADMTGVETTFAGIAAEAFGVNPSMVRVVGADTASAPYAGASGGSKITYTVGRAVEQAARQAREQLLEVAADEMEISPEDLEIVDGRVQPLGDPERGVSLQTLAGKVLTYGSRHPPIEGHGRSAQLPQAPQAAGHLCHVHVDPDTGAVRVLAHVVAQDVGRALNPALVQGQMHGGAVQGLGWALHEEMVHDEHGQLITGTLIDYALPSAADVPFVDTEIVEVPVPDGPFGAKGVGEPPVIAAAAAVANAIAAAVGVRMRQLPMTAERVWRELSRAD